MPRACSCSADLTYDNDFFIRGFAELGVTFHEVPLQPRGLNPLNGLRSYWLFFKRSGKIQPDTVLSYTVKCNVNAGFARQLLRFEQIANVPGLGEVFEKKNLLCLVVSCCTAWHFVECLWRSSRTAKTSLIVETEARSEREMCSDSRLGCGPHPIPSSLSPKKSRCVLPRLGITE